MNTILFAELDGSFFPKTTVSTGLIDDPNFDKEILQIMEEWQKQLANGEPMKGSIKPLGTGTGIRLDDVAEFSEWKNDGKTAVKLISFNLLATFGLTHNKEIVSPKLGLLRIDGRRIGSTMNQPAHDTNIRQDPPSIR